MQPPLGLRPSLENHPLGDLGIDPAYQRGVDNGQSQSLIRKIAAKWDWRLFHPLSVSRRDDGTLWVVDGQHRLAAAKMRGDLADLPCVVTRFTGGPDEAASFVSMNTHRRSLNPLDIFRASLASGDPEAAEVMDIISHAKLSLASHSNASAWQLGEISNIAGIRRTYRALGRSPTSAALVAISTSWPNEKLVYAGTIFLGLAKAFDELLGVEGFDPDLFFDVIAGASQAQWYQDILAERVNGAGNVAIAGHRAFLAAYREASGADESTVDPERCEVSAL